MVVVSYSGKEINAKLVYYGAGLSGKTTNLEAIYEAVPETSRGKMVSMKTQSDRTLFFDLLPLDLGEIMGFKTRFLLYTVPGQVFYNATRKLVLKGADAIVFVADSEVGKMDENIESLANLRANLAEYKVSLDDIPWVIQYNKRDLPNLYTCDELNAEMNPGAKVPFFEAVATQGKGVFETFRGISHLLMEKVTRDLRRAPGAAQASRPAATPIEQPSAPKPPSPPPMAPARLIEREAQETSTAGNGGEIGGLDYGRNIQLPDAFPPAAPEPYAPATARAAAPPPPVQAPVRMVPAYATPLAPAMTQAPPMPAPVMSPAPLPQPTMPQAPSMAAPEPVVPASRPAPRPAQPASRPRAAEGESAPASVVIPVTLPAAGQTGEIVIRIILKTAE